jgi:large subunit ribosomal protein L18Ae
MYKEYRDVSRTLAVQSLYSDMAARHRARFRSIHVPSSTHLWSVSNQQIIRVVEIPKTEDVKRPYIRQLLAKNLKFPLPHRVPKGVGKKVFSAQRPATW